MSSSMSPTSRLSLIHLLYPPACLLCHAPMLATRMRQTGQVGPASCWICELCANAMPRNGPPVCSTCGVELPGAFDAHVLCAACRTRPPVFDLARAPWRYTGLAQEAIRRFKYHRRWRIGGWLAEDMATTARASLPLDEVEAVVPVPLHWLKRRLRGGNPTEQLASPVSRALSKPYMPDALRRVRWTTTQTRLSWRRRFQNVRQAFSARPRRVRDRTLLLIDDVLTSGATANACSLALKSAGARRVFVLTAARTPLG